MWDRYTMEKYYSVGDLVVVYTDACIVKGSISSFDEESLIVYKKSEEMSTFMECRLMYEDINLIGVETNFVFNNEKFDIEDAEEDDFSIPNAG